MEIIDFFKNLFRKKDKKDKKADIYKALPIYKDEMFSHDRVWRPFLGGD